METNNIDIKINGLTEENSRKVVESIINLLEKFYFLDLRRFHDIIICDDVNSEINSILGNEYKFVTNRYNKNSDVYAKVTTVVNENDIKIVLVLNNNFALDLIKQLHCKQEYKNALHVFHHELSHIHDFNKKIDIFEKELRSGYYEGIDKITYPIAEICWSEYIANFLSSSSTVKSSYPSIMANSLSSLVNLTEKSIQTNLMVYKSNRSRVDILEEITAQVEHLFKTASYLLGYIHGLDINLSDISDEALFQVEKSNFAKTWEDMSYELTSIRSVYPHGWEKIKIYENLSLCVLNYFKEFGILIKQDEKKELYISIV